MERRDALRLGAVAAALGAAGPLAVLLLRDDGSESSGRGATPTGSDAASPGSSPSTSPPGDPTPTPTTPRAPDYGPLDRVEDETTGEVLLLLPAGFRYRSLDWTGETMSDGHPVPPFPDGMGAFAGPDGGIVLVRNHEVFAPQWAGRVVGDEAVAYDARAGGGTTTLELDADARLVRSRASLGGTLANCAGGPTPWGTWLSCEESIRGVDVADGPSEPLRERHGYVYEVPAVDAGSPRRGPITAAGRFEHEAVAWPGDGYLYLTEDDADGPSGFYRYRPPNDPQADGYLADGGTLEMLEAVGSPDLSGAVEVGRHFRVRWVPIADPDPRSPGRRPSAEVRLAVVDQGRAAGGTVFSRLEGCWAEAGRVFFASTQGGAPVESPPGGFGDGRGQIWALDLVAQLLTCILAPESDEELANPDNLTISPSGGLVICEDRPADQPQRLRAVGRDGTVADLAENAISGYAHAEMAGVCFDPTGRYLFVNIQGDDGRQGGGVAPGVTLAIWGPWEQGPL